MPSLATRSGLTLHHALVASTNYLVVDKIPQCPSPEAPNIQAVVLHGEELRRLVGR